MSSSSIVLINYIDSQAVHIPKHQDENTDQTRGTMEVESVSKLNMIHFRKKVLFRYREESISLILTTPRIDAETT